MRQFAFVSGREYARRILGIIALTGALFRTFPSQMIKLSEHVFVAEFNLARWGALARLFPFWQLGEEPFFGTLRLCDMRFQHARPRPAQPLKRLQC